MDKIQLKNELSNLTVKKYTISKEVYNFNQLELNYNNMLKNKTWLELFKYMRILTNPIVFDYMLVSNMNYSSIIWDYFRVLEPSMTNGLYQEFKSNMFKNINYNSESKLNMLGAFNDMLSLIVFDCISILSPD